MDSITSLVVHPPVRPATPSQNSIAIPVSAETNIEQSPIATVSNRRLSSIDFTLAERPLELNEFHIVEDTDSNRKIKWVIKKGLSTLECSPIIKRKIFENIMNIERNIEVDGGSENRPPRDENYLITMNVLLEEIRISGDKIILDNTDFTGINLKNLNLTGASVISAKFADMQMNHIIWNNVDFSDVRFFSVQIHHCHFVDTRFTMTIFMGCFLRSGILNDVTILTTRFYETTFNDVVLSQLKTDDAYLRKKIAQSTVRHASTIQHDQILSHLPYFLYYTLHRQKELDYTKDQFHNLLNLKYTSDDFRTRSAFTLRTSLVIGEAIPELPIYAADLISQYACEDDSWAKQPLQTKFRTVIDSEKNKLIKSAIKKVLTSRDYAPSTKAIIFKNMMDFNEHFKSIVIPNFNLSEKEKTGVNHYIQVINELLDEIRDSEHPIILDHVDFTGINLMHLNLSGASAKSVKFCSMKMEYLIWKNGDFSKSKFDNVNILQCRFKNAIFNETLHIKTYFYLSEITQVKMLGVEFQRTKFNGVFANRVVTDDPRLRRKINRSKVFVRPLAQACLKSEVLKKSIFSVFIVKYSQEEGVDAVNFLAFEFSTKRLAEKKSVRTRIVGFLDLISAAIK